MDHYIHFRIHIHDMAILVFIKGSGLSFLHFLKKRGFRICPWRDRGVSNIGRVVLKKGVSLTNTDKLFIKFSFSVYACVFCSFIPFLSTFIEIHRKNPVLLNLISKFDFYKQVIFEKQRHCWPLQIKILNQQVNHSA